MLAQLYCVDGEAAGLGRDVQHCGGSGALRLGGAAAGPGISPQYLIMLTG